MSSACCSFSVRTLLGTKPSSPLLFLTFHHSLDTSSSYGKAPSIFPSSFHLNLRFETVGTTWHLHDFAFPDGQLSVVPGDEVVHDAHATQLLLPQLGRVLYRYPCRLCYCCRWRRHLFGGCLHTQSKCPRGLFVCIFSPSTKERMYEGAPCWAGAIEPPAASPGSPWRLRGPP